MYKMLQNNLTKGSEQKVIYYPKHSMTTILQKLHPDQIFGSAVWRLWFMTKSHIISTISILTCTAPLCGSVTQTFEKFNFKSGLCESPSLCRNKIFVIVHNEYNIEVGRLGHFWHTQFWVWMYSMWLLFEGVWVDPQISVHVIGTPLYNNVESATSA